MALSQTLLDGTAALGLVAAAEMGDKSQLVCMSLAARHRGLPVMAGAVGAFALLNAVAVLFGAGVSQALPAWLVSGAVALLFFTFGIRAWRTAPAAGDVAVQAPPAPGRSILLSTFLLIFFAEFGDKTQLVVAGLASTQSPIGVWIGATAGLMLTTLLGVAVGRTLLQKLPLVWIYRLSACVFAAFAMIAGYHALLTLPW